MTVTVSESMTVTEFVTEFVFVTASVIYCPFPLIVPVTFSARGWGHDHIFKRVTVRVTACKFSVSVPTHNHPIVRISVNMRFRVQES